MFQVLYPPFTGVFDQNLDDEKVHAVLVETKEGKHLVLKQCTTFYGDVKEAEIQAFEGVAAFLEVASLSSKKLMLESLAKDDAFPVMQPIMSAAPYRRQASFAEPSYPGQGGSGIDSYW